jgi:hypothetical protein
VKLVNADIAQDAAFVRNSGGQGDQEARRRYTLGLLGKIRFLD